MRILRAVSVCERADCMGVQSLVGVGSLKNSLSFFNAARYSAERPNFALCEVSAPWQSKVRGALGRGGERSMELRVLTESIVFRRATPTAAS